MPIMTFAFIFLKKKLKEKEKGLDLFIYCPWNQSAP